MVSLSISLNQLVDVINGLNEIERIQVKSALEGDLIISDDTRDELLRRKKSFKEGEITSSAWSEIKARYESL